MTYKLWDALLATAQELAITKESTATGGTTTTLIDTVARTEVDDYWNEGTVWYVDADGTETYNNYCAVINDFDYDSNTLSFATQTAAPESGDRYIVATPRYTLDMLKSAINSVLQTAKVLDVDETVSIEEDTTEYTLPTTIYRGNLMSVWYQTETDNSDDNWWQEIQDWRVIDSDTGTGDTLVLFQQYTADRTLQLHYLAYHPILSSISGEINELIDLEGLTIRAAIWCMRSRMAGGAKDRWMAQLVNELIARREVIPLTKKVYKRATRKKPYIERRSTT